MCGGDNIWLTPLNAFNKKGIANSSNADDLSRIMKFDPAVNASTVIGRLSSLRDQSQSRYLLCTALLTLMIYVSSKASGIIGWEDKVRV